MTLTQLESLRHPTGGLASPDEFVSLAAGALNAVLTVTDGDLDVATATVDLGNVVRFEDDAPTAALALQGGVTVVVDESLGQNGAPETEGGASGLGRVTVLGTTLFTSTAITGQDNEGRRRCSRCRLSAPARPGCSRRTTRRSRCSTTAAE